MHQKRFHGMVIGLVTLTLVLTLTQTARADGGATGSKATVNGYQIVLILTEPAKVGENQFHVQITDPMGMPVTAAEVVVTAMSADNMSKLEHSPTSPAVPTAGVGDVQGMSGMPGMDVPTPAADMNMSGMNMSGMATPAEPSTHNTHADEHTEPTVAENAAILTSALKPAGEAGEYTGEISLDKTGGWTFNVHFTLNGQMTAAEFSVEVLEAVRNYGLVIGIFGFNATVILTAAVLKRKAAIA
jgi:hypothetical protein